MYISIKREKCMGHGRCYGEAPDLLSDDEEGFVEQGGTTFEVPAALIGQAQIAVDACPELAILLVAKAPSNID